MGIFPAFGKLSNAAAQCFRPEQAVLHRKDLRRDGMRGTDIHIPAHVFALVFIRRAERRDRALFVQQKMQKLIACGAHLLLRIIGYRARIRGQIDYVFVFGKGDPHVRYSSPY